MLTKDDPIYQEVVGKLIRMCVSQSLQLYGEKLEAEGADFPDYMLHFAGGVLLDCCKIISNSCTTTGEEMISTLSVFDALVETLREAVVKHGEPGISH